MPLNVFLSFATEDKHLVDLFRGQAKNEHSGLEFRDYSVKEPFDAAWKINCERIIGLCSVLICLVGEDTHRSDAVNWEIKKAEELGKGIMAVCLAKPDPPLPEALEELRIQPIPWDINLVAKELDRVAR